MTCRMTTENVSEPLPNLAELLAVNRSLKLPRWLRPPSAPRSSLVAAKALGRNAPAIAATVFGR
jgi:hypothetical protein